MPLTPEEFATWLAPRQAIALLNGLGSISTIVEAINDRVMSGHLRMAAAEARTFNQPPVEYGLIKPELWKAADPSYHHDFWARADIQFTMDRHQRSQRSIRLTAVRIDPEGIQRILCDAGLTALPTTAPVTAVSDQPAKATVSKADLARWHEVFTGVHPEAPEALALQSAAAMFPDKHVPRQFVRDLRGPQKRGKPPRRRD